MTRSTIKFLGCTLFAFYSTASLTAQQPLGDPLPGTRPLHMTGDIASELVAGVDRFLLRELQRSIAQREQHWQRNFSSGEAYEKSIEPNRQRLAHLLGVRDKRAGDTMPRLTATVSQPALVGRGHGYEILAISWPAFGDVKGRGLLLAPKDAEPITAAKRR